MYSLKWVSTSHHVSKAQLKDGTHPKSSTVLDVNSAVETNLIKC
jgi:hypothetical protein